MTTDRDENNQQVSRLNNFDAYRELRYGQPLIKIRGIIQEVMSSAKASFQNVTATAETDITDLSVSITTQGGWLEIDIIPDPTSSSSISNQIYNATTEVIIGYIRAVVGSTNLVEYTFGHNNSVAVAEALYFSLGDFKWYAHPAAGTYVVKIQSYTLVSGVTIFYDAGSVLRVREISQ